MKRIVVIDLADRNVFIEDIPDDILETYQDVTDYIQDNYALEGKWTWGFADSITYIDESGYTMDVEPKDWK